MLRQRYRQYIWNNSNIHLNNAIKCHSFNGIQLGKIQMRQTYEWNGSVELKLALKHIVSNLYPFLIWLWYVSYEWRFSPEFQSFLLQIRLNLFPFSLSLARSLFLFQRDRLSKIGLSKVSAHCTSLFKQ